MLSSTVCPISKIDTTQCTKAMTVQQRRLSEVNCDLASGNLKKKKKAKREEKGDVESVRITIAVSA